MGVLNMALKPVLKLKVDELFLRWLSHPDTQQLLKNNLNQIQNGEPLTYAPQTTNSYARSSKGQSPRVRPGSPSTPPFSPNMASPRSPRKNLNSKSHRSINSKLNLSTNGSNQSQNSKDTFPKRGDPDGQSDTFIHPKEPPMQEKVNDSQSNKDTDLPEALYSKVSVPVKGNLAKGSGKFENAKEATSQPHVHKLGTVESSCHSQDSKAGHNSSLSLTISTSKSTKRTGFVNESKSDSDLLVSQHGSVHIPQFYFPGGHPGDNSSKYEETLMKIKEIFSNQEGGKATKQTFGALAKACGMSLFMKSIMFKQFGGEKSGHVTLQQFLAQWKKLCSSYKDDASRFLHLMAKSNRHYLEDEDFVPLIQEVVESHPGLTFLQDSPEFHSRYVQTVISRIFYCVNRSWTGRITLREIRHSNLLQTLRLLDDEEDINQITDYFSYEHFYVIYCKFWELDKDHDLFISKEDLARHNDHAISSKMIDRIFSGAVTKYLKDNKLSYKDFVWFLISEEDKKHLTSQEYWFRCMDLDGDGVISMYEMEYFYQEQVEKMEQLGIETLPFEDTLCQMLDMIRPKTEGMITLRDLKACKLTHIFFDTFFNLDKYLEHEQKDPFANARDIEDGEPELSDWERYASEEYELLVAEEGANENHEELIYEDDFEVEDDAPTTPITSAPSTMVNNLSTDTKTGENRTAKGSRPRAPSPEDIYDFSTKDLGY